MLKMRQVEGQSEKKHDRDVYISDDMQHDAVQVYMASTMTALMVEVI